MSYHSKEPISNFDYYTKSDVAKFILEKSPATIGSWIKDGKLFEPRFSKIPNNENSRKYYSLADAMRMSIILYGSIHMDKIYSLGLSKCISDEFSGLEDSESLLLAYSNNGLINHFKEEIRQSFRIVKNQIVEKSNDPIDLLPYLNQEEEING